MTIDPNEYQLPCDVKLPPATRIKRGCTLNTLLVAMQQRESFPPAERVFNDATPPAAQVQGEKPSYGWRKEALAFVGVAEAGAFADLRAAVKTAAMIIQGLLNDDTVQLIREHRIALTPEYEGQWHAELYGDDGVAQKYAEGATPDEAVRAVLSSTALTPTHIEDGEEVDVTDAMLEKAMNARMPGGAPAWVWLFNCEGGQQPEDKHKDWFRVVLRAALSAPPAAGVLESRTVTVPPMVEFDDMVNRLFELDADAKKYCCRHWLLTIWKATLARVCELNPAPTPPASEQQQAVVMPERIRAGSERGIDDPGFNAALDELLRLNPHLAKGEGV